MVHGWDQGRYVWMTGTVVERYITLCLINEPFYTTVMPTLLRLPLQLQFMRLSCSHGACLIISGVLLVALKVLNRLLVGRLLDRNATDTDYYYVILLRFKGPPVEAVYSNSRVRAASPDHG